MLSEAILQSVTTSVCVQIHWLRAKEQVGLHDLPVPVVYQAVRQAGLPQLCHQDIHTPLG